MTILPFAVAVQASTGQAATTRTPRRRRTRCTLAPPSSSAGRRKVARWQRGRRWRRGRGRRHGLTSDHLVGAVDDGCIGAGAAVDVVYGPVTGQDRVVVRLAVHDVRAAASFERVGPWAAEQTVRLRATGQCVPGGTADHRLDIQVNVIALALNPVVRKSVERRRHGVDALIVRRKVISVATVELVGTRTAVEPVVAALPVQLVDAIVAVELVVVEATPERVGSRSTTQQEGKFISMPGLA